MAAPLLIDPAHHAQADLDAALTTLESIVEHETLTGSTTERTLHLAELVETTTRRLTRLQLHLAATLEHTTTPPEPGHGVLVDHTGTLPRPTLVPDTSSDGSHDAANSGAGTTGVQHSGCAPTGRSGPRTPYARARDLLRMRLRISGAEAGRRIRLGHALAPRTSLTGQVLPPEHPVLASALPHVDREATTEVLRALERVAAVLDHGDVSELEQVLTTHATRFDPDQLRRIATHAVAVADPDGAAPSESLKQIQQGVHIGPTRKGLTTIRLVVDAVQLEILQTVFDTGTNPHTTTPTPTGADSASPSAATPATNDGAATLDGSVPDSNTIDGESQTIDADDESVFDQGETVNGGAGGDVPAQSATGGPPALVAMAERRTRPQIMLDTLIAATMCILRTGALPTTGGAPTQVIITLDGADLLTALRHQTPGPTAGTRASLQRGPGERRPDTREHSARHSRTRPGDGATGSPGPENPTDRWERSSDGAATAPPAVHRSEPATGRPDVPPPARPDTTHTDTDTDSNGDTDAPAPSEQDLDGVAWLIHEGPVSLRSVRRLACDADLVPVVLGTGSRILDLGRSHRLVPAWMRTALTARDGGCLFPGCHIPATWCDAHHIIPWYQGGATSTDNAALLCGYHHHLIHTGDWTITTSRPGATPTITPGPELTPTHHHAWTPTPEQRTNRYHRC